jgi:hypothetical protein
MTTDLQSIEIKEVRLCSFAMDSMFGNISKTEVLYITENDPQIKKLTKKK